MQQPQELSPLDLEHVLGGVAPEAQPRDGGGRGFGGPNDGIGGPLINRPEPPGPPGAV